jgi:hypothetical protein
MAEVHFSLSFPSSWEYRHAPQLSSMSCALKKKRERGRERERERKHVQGGEELFVSHSVDSQVRLSRSVRITLEGPPVRAFRRSHEGVLRTGSRSSGLL